MTCIIWKDGKLLTDSCSVNGVEWVEDGRKATQVYKETYITTDEDPIPDPIVGFTFEHARAPAMELLAALQTVCKFHMKDVLENGSTDKSVERRLRTLYRPMASLKVMNNENYFRAVLIGLRKNYIFEICEYNNNKFGEEYSGLRIWDKAEPIATGTGSYIARDLMVKEPKAQAIRLMHAVMESVSTVSGRIYQYEVLPSIRSNMGHELVCTGMWEEPNDFLKKIAEHSLIKPCPPDLTVNSRAYEYTARDPAKNLKGDWRKSEFQRFMKMFKPTRTTKTRSRK